MTTLLQKMLLIGVFITAWMWISSENHRDDLLDEQHYCSMTSIHKASNGEYGWPPYRPEINCNNNN
tara:strand:- start:295 stop:492 length:198 start_codon:yes stop_codon:yes gene_type:complete